MIKLGLLPSPQYTTWDAMRDAATKMDALGYDSLWCSDHLYAPYPWVVGPAFESYSILAGCAAVTERVTLGAMVTAVGFRDPALLAKMVTTIDHISHGRAILGIGAGWFEDEHRSFGFDFDPPPDRLARLDEALGIIRAMFSGETVSGTRFYRHDEVSNLPSPVQERLPILVGGRGDKMLGLVAKHADIWNLAGFIDDVTQRTEVLRRRCDEIGRDFSTIERTYHGGPVFIRDTVEDAKAVQDKLFSVHGIPDMEIPFAGPPELVAERLAPFIELGFHHVYFDLVSPYDDESMERLVKEVRPMLLGSSVTGG